MGIAFDQHQNWHWITAKIFNDVGFFFVRKGKLNLMSNWGFFLPRGVLFASRGIIVGILDTLKNVDALLFFKEFVFTLSGDEEDSNILLKQCEQKILLIFEVFLLNDRLVNLNWKKILMMITNDYLDFLSSLWKEKNVTISKNVIKGIRP